MTEKSKTRWTTWLPCLALLLVAVAVPLAAAETTPPAAVPALQPEPVMTPSAPFLAGDGAAPIFLAQCLPPCLTCQPGFFCGRNAHGCLVCMRCTNPDPRFCPSGG
jgi:hypothetical protein